MYHTMYIHHDTCTNTVSYMISRVQRRARSRWSPAFQPEPGTGSMPAQRPLGPGGCTVTLDSDSSRPGRRRGSGDGRTAPSLNLKSAAAGSAQALVLTPMAGSELVVSSPKSTQFDVGSLIRAFSPGQPGLQLHWHFHQQQ